MTSLVLLVDGHVADTLSSMRADAATRIASIASRLHPECAVALCRLGDARSLRRFERGAEVLA